MGLADNYWFDTKSPLDSMLGGVNSWQLMKQNDNTLAQQQEANRIAQAQNDLKIQAMNEAQTLDYNDPVAMQKFVAKYQSTGITKGIDDYVANLNAKEQENLTSQLSQVTSAIRNGRSDLAVSMAKQYAEAYKNAGNTAKYNEYMGVAQQIEQSPETWYQGAQITLAHLVGKDDATAMKDIQGAYAPDTKPIDMGGEQGVWQTDPVTGEVTYTKLGDKSISPDEQLRADTSITNNENDNETRITTANIAADTSRYAADRSSETGRYVADRNYQGTVYKETAETSRFNAEQKNLMNSSEEVEKGGYLFRKYKNGRVDFLGPAKTTQSPANIAKVAEIQGMNDTANQLIQSLQKARELNKQGVYSGYAAGGRADLMGNFGGTEESRRTQQYNNIITGAALQQLKALFGAAPTEGEREILMKIQASANYPPQVREQLLNDAIVAAQARIASNNRQIGTLTGQQPSYPQASAPPSSIARPQQQQSGGYISGKYK